MFTLPAPLHGQFRYEADTTRRPFTAAPTVPGNTFRFIVTADRTGGERPGVFRRAVERVRNLSPDFVITVGDQIDGYTTDSAHATAQWEEFDTLSRRFGAPLFLVAGNHDYSNELLGRIWVERFGCSYYHFRLGEALFLILNSEEPLGNGRCGISDKQADSFTALLENEPDTGPTFVFMHTPLWDTGDDPNYNRIERLLRTRQTTVFSGHTHRYYYSEKNGYPHYNLATMGGDSPMRGPAMGEFDHFMLVEVQDGRVGVHNISVDGKPLPVDAVNEKSRRAVELLTGEKWLHVIPTVAGSTCVDRIETALVLNNPADRPLRMTLRAPQIAGGRFEPAEILREIPAASGDTIPITIRFDRPQAVDSLPAISIDCRGSYLIDGREVAATARKRWLVDCIRPCGARPDTIRVMDPFYVREVWDWHSPDDGAFRFTVTRTDGTIRIHIETDDDRLLTDPDPSKLQDRLIVCFTPDGAETRRIELTAGCSIEQPLRATCRATSGGLAADALFPAEGVRRFRLNIGFIDCDNTLNTKPSQLWWRPGEKDPGADARFGTFIVDPE